MRILFIGGTGNISLACSCAALEKGCLPEPLVEAIHRETEGNPFFVHEVVRLLTSDGRLAEGGTVESWSLEIPQGVREVVGRRLNRLSDACNELLLVGSVIGVWLSRRCPRPCRPTVSRTP